MFVCKIQISLITSLGVHAVQAAYVEETSTLKVYESLLAFPSAYLDHKNTIIFVSMTKENNPIVNMYRET